MIKALSLYFHIPYCSYKCPYCDFNTYAVTSVPDDEYTEALIKELTFYASQPGFTGRTVSTIYFGGGTPSLLSASSISRIITSIEEKFSLSASAEISLEANPEKLEYEYLSKLKSVGVSRLSLGVQSFSDHVLEKLGRGHRASDVSRTFENARRAGLDNISLDLIFAVPGQTLTDLGNDLQAALALSPEHISTYELTIEKGTPFYEGQQRGVFAPVDEELILEMMDLVEKTLFSSGYGRYEISNYAKSGSESKHNLNYWQAGDYLGLGAGAHSHLQVECSRRWSNFALPKKYIQSVDQSGQAVSWQEELSQAAQAFEFFFLGLRRAQGVNLTEFRERFGDRNYRTALGLASELQVESLADTIEPQFRLSPRGLKIIDSVLERFSSSFDTQSVTDRA